MSASSATTDTPLRQAWLRVSRTQAGELVLRDFDVLVQVRLGLSRLHAPVSFGALTVSSRFAMNNPVRSFQRTQIFKAPLFGVLFSIADCYTMKCVERG